VSRDDDALSWQGDEDPTLDVGTPARAAEQVPADSAGGSSSVTASDEAVLPDGYTAVGKGSGDVTRAGDAAAPDGAVEPSQIGNVGLVALGILGGVYLLYTIGWIIGGLRLQVIAPALLVSPVAYVPAFWLAVLAPAIWFAATLFLTRRSATWLRFAWLAAGAVLLVPWPFIMIGAIGQ
jgi:hypothetical protein